MKHADTVVKRDLDYICQGLQPELKCMSGEKLLITGGAGFLGYYLIQAITHWNKHVSPVDRVQITVFDNFIRGCPEWLQTLGDEGRLDLVRYDVARTLPEGIPDFQYIIHAASVASPTYYRMHPIETMDANVNGLRNILEYSQRQAQRGNEVSGILYFSSSEIYGDPLAEFIPTPEHYNGNVSCTGPRSCYDESKRYGETLAVNFARVFELPIKIVRPFNNYGPGLNINDRRVVSDFARDILLGRDIVMHSDGLPTRTFCYAADAVTGYYKILVRGHRGEPYNIGADGPEVSIADLAQRMGRIAREHLGWKGNVVHTPSSQREYLVDSPERRCPSIEKARTELGYEPSVSLDDGLLRSLTWYQEHR
jgi:UDP-glucuronate decarboxylase